MDWCGINIIHMFNNKQYNLIVEVINLNIILQKFGGISLENTNKLFLVCKHIISEIKKGNKVVVVASAQGDTTDDLIKEEKEITECANKRQHDVLVSTGEQVAIAKLAMCLESLGYKAKSYLGWQLPIITNSDYSNAKIEEIKTDKILNDLENNYVVIVAGFQGVDKDNNITTLGRGGSDTTAIALASKLKVKECILFKDVDGIYSLDPNKYKNAIKYNKISYDKMLELANNGACVLHNKCIKIAKDNLLKIVVKKAFSDNSIGTIVGG